LILSDDVTSILLTNSKIINNLMIYMFLVKKSAK
jgi:hypothetical protein